MNQENTKFIGEVTTENTGGGCWVDFIYLKDGRVIGLNEECVVLYESIDDFWFGETKERPTFTIPHIHQ